MKLKDMIRDTENQKIQIEFIKNGFNNFWNEYAPTSRFYTKDIDGNKTLYVRRDFDKCRKHNVYTFESWIRDNNKSIHDKDIDTNRKRYSTINKITDLLEFIRQ